MDKTRRDPVRLLDMSIAWRSIQDSPSGAAPTC